MGIVEETRQLVDDFQKKFPGKRVAIKNGGLELVPETKEEVEAFQTTLDVLSDGHPTSAEMWRFLEETKYDAADMFPILRMFVAAEYDRDPEVLDRLKVWLDEMKEAKNEV